MQKNLRSRWPLLILFSGLKRPFVLAALVLMLAMSNTSLPPSKVASTATCPENMILQYFYSDDTYQVEVGQRHYWCDGRITGHGIMTLYDLQENYMPCCGCGPFW